MDFLSNFNPMKFIESCEWMGKGMLAIIIVMAVLILITALLNKIPTKDENDK